MARKLSKIPADNEKLLGNITDILGYMKMLEEVDTVGVTPTVSVVENNAFLREDSLESPFSTTPGSLLKCSQQKVVANQVVLPNIMK